MKAAILTMTSFALFAGCAPIGDFAPTYPRLLNFGDDTITVKPASTFSHSGTNYFPLVPGAGYEARYKEDHLVSLEIVNSQGRTFRYSEEDLAKIRSVADDNHGFLLWSHDTLQFEWNERYLRRRQVEVFQERDQRKLFDLQAQTTQ